VTGPGDSGYAMARTNTTKRRVEEMYAAHLDGASLREAGEPFGMSPSKVSQLFKEAGLKVRPRNLPPPRQYPLQEMYAYYKTGALLSEVGEKFDVSPSHVRTLFLKNRLTRLSWF